MPVELQSTVYKRSFGLLLNRGRTKVKVSKAGLVEGILGAASAVAGVAGTALALLTRDPLWLALPAVSGAALGGATAVVTVRNKFREWVVATANALGRDGPQRYVGNPVKDAKSYVGTNKRFDLVGFIGGSSLKGSGGGTRPVSRIQDQVEAEAPRKMEALDVAMKGSAINDLYRQGSAADLHANRRVGKEIRALVVDIGNQAVLTGEEYDVNAHMRALLNEYTEPGDFQIRPVPDGGADLVIVPPNTFDVVTAEGNIRFFSKIKTEYRERADKLYGDLMSFIDDYRKDRPERAGNISVVERPKEIHFTEADGFHLPEAVQRKLEENIAARLVESLKKPYREPRARRRQGSRTDQGLAATTQVNRRSFSATGRTVAIRTPTRRRRQSIALSTAG